MQQQQQSQQSQGSWTPIEDAKSAFSLLAFASQVIAHPVEVFLRTGFGSQYFGIASLVAFFAVPMWMVFFPTESPVGIWCFWLLYIAMQVRARIETARLKSKGEVIHSRYNGWPRLAKAFKSLPESRVKAAIEPLAVFLCALAVMQGSVPLASYLIAAAFALAFNNALIDAVERARIRELNDAMIEQQQTAERFRAMRGEL
ncbi:MAG: hypothetical protein U0640_13445 [Phycisphaerales bacterium]